jgi:hypothetical protein
MKKRPSDPARLVDLPPGHDLAKLAPLIRDGTQEPPDGSPLLKWRVRNTLRRRSEWRRRALRVVLVGGLVFCAGGVVGAMVHPILLSRVQSKTRPALDAQTPPSRQHSVQGRGRPASPVLSPAPLESEPLTPSPAPAPPAGATGMTELPKPIPSSESPAQAASVASTRTPPEVAVNASSGPLVRHPSATSDGPRPRRARPSLPQLAVLAQGSVDPSRIPRAPAPAYAPIDVPSPVAPPAQVAPPPVLPPIGNPQLAAMASPSPPAPAARFPLPSGAETAWNRGSAPVYPPAPRAPSDLPATKAPAAAPPDEQALLTRALHGLRIARSPESALAALDEHAARFPAGALTPEAARLRIEALLLLGRKDAALAELDRQSSDVLPGNDERRVLRGELRARAGRWRAALADFDAIVRGFSGVEVGGGKAADPKAGDCLERALWGRASARSHLGDETGARADLQDYLHRYPRGRFAAEAMRLLGERR